VRSADAVNHNSIKNAPQIGVFSVAETDRYPRIGYFGA